MNPSSRIPDDAGDRQTQDQLRRWFRKTSGVPPMRSSFTRSLSEQLDAEFASEFSGNRIADLDRERQQEEASVNGSVNGHKTLAAGEGVERLLVDAFETQGPQEQAGEQSVAQDQELPAALNSPANQRAGRQKTMNVRLLLTAAASLLVVAGLWSSRPGYSFARMIDALDQQTWIHSETLQGKVVRLRRWVSVVYGVDATRTEEEVRFADHDDSVMLVYQPGDNKVVSEATTDEQSPANTTLTSAKSALLSFLLPGDQQEVIVSEESWKRVAGEDGQPLIELSVTLVAEGKQHRWQLWLNPETHLPVSARKLAEQNGATNGETPSSEEFRFSYPQDGPESIYSLGVPKETQVVSLRADATPPPEMLARVNRPEMAIPAIDLPVRNRLEQFVEPSVDAPADPNSDELAPPRLAAASKAAKSALEPALEPLPAAQKPRKSKPSLGPPLPSEALTKQINTLLADHWESVGIEPVGRSSDAEFLRRVYLDLIGRIPTVGEARQFLESTGEVGATSAERAALVDDLLASRDHATHLAAVWRRGLIPAAVDLGPYGGPEKLDEWLADRFQKNLPYDELASELLLAEGRISESGPLLFYAATKMNAEEIASQTSRTFLGMQIDCAMCHDHLFDDRLTQEDFWGFAALFAQISRPRGKIEIVSPVMRVHDNRRGEVTLPDTDIIIPPRLPLSDVVVDMSDSAPPRRQQFVDWLVDPHNAQFSQATVNRVWAHLFGRGLVEPVDDIRPENPAVVPELFDLLGKDFARSGFDMRRLLRQIVLSDAYGLTSESADDEPARPLVFAQMNIKSLTAEQLHDCIAVATRTAAVNGPNQMGLVRFGNSSRDAFISLFEAPGGKPVDFHAGIPQALTLMHGGLTDAATQFSTSGLLKSINAPFFSDDQRIETLFLATLSRLPSESERGQMRSYLSDADESEIRLSRLGDMLWALLNAAEFTLNH